jgi:hypothetical protein
MTYWGYLSDYIRDVGMDRLAAAGTVLAAEYQWKCSKKEVQQWSYDPAWELHRRFGRAPLRRKGSTYADLPVAPLCNAKLGADRRFPLLGADEVAKIARELADTPEGFKLNVTSDGKIAAALLSDGADDYPARKVTIPVNGRCGGLTLLLTASRPNAPQNLLNQKSQPRIRFFPKVATLKIAYADGKTRSVPIRHNLEISDWNANAGGYNCRMVVRDNDADGANYAIYAYDWHNPRPKAEIRSVELSTEKIPAKGNPRIALALLAASANVPGGMKPAAAEHPGELREHNVADGNRKIAIRKITAVDFTKGMGKVHFTTEGTFVRPVTCKVVADAGSPSGKALKVVMPPVKEGSRVPRAIVDVPVPKLAKLGSVVFSIRTDSPALIRRSGAYFMNRDTTLHNVIFNYMRKDTDKWQHFEIPFKMMPEHEPWRGVSLDNVRTIRVTVWLENADRDVTVWFGPIAASPDEAMYTSPASTAKIE